MDNAALNYLELVERLTALADANYTEDLFGRALDDAIAAITRLVKERDEAREGLDRLEAAYGILSDDVFLHYAAKYSKADSLLRKFSWEKDQ